MSVQVAHRVFSFSPIQLKRENGKSCRLIVCIQGDSPSMVTITCSNNDAFIKILIFAIFKYTKNDRNFIFLKLLYYLKCSVAIQTSIF